MIIQFHKSEGFFWIRIFGKGVYLANRKIYKPPFSVRKGYSKEYGIGKWRIGWLKSL